MIYVGKYIRVIVVNKCKCTLASFTISIFFLQPAKTRQYSQHLWAYIYEFLWLWCVYRICIYIGLKRIYTRRIIAIWVSINKSITDRVRRRHRRRHAAAAQSAYCNTSTQSNAHILKSEKKLSQSHQIIKYAHRQQVLFVIIYVYKCRQAIYELSAYRKRQQV